MTKEIPSYALRAYGLLFTKYRLRPFSASALNWMVSEAMKKKIFWVLKESKWIEKSGSDQYVCRQPKQVFKELFEFKVPTALKQVVKAWRFIGMSAVEIWTDYSYIQRSWEHSPYFIEVEQKDIKYWKKLLSAKGIPYFMKNGSSIGEFVILMPVKKIKINIHNDANVMSIKETFEYCKENAFTEYPLAYLSKKYHLKAEIDERLLAKVSEAL